jgi:probable HAF family extracellular repeat protein
MFTSLSARYWCLLAFLGALITTASATQTFDFPSGRNSKVLWVSNGVELGPEKITLTSETLTAGSVFISHPVYVRHFRFRTTMNVSNARAVGGELSVCFQASPSQRQGDEKHGFSADCHIGTSNVMLTIRTGTPLHAQLSDGCSKINCVALRVGETRVFQPFDLSKAGISVTTNHSLTIEFLYYNGLLQITVTDNDRRLSINKSYRLNLPEALHSVAANVGVSASSEGGGLVQQVTSLHFESATPVYSIIDLGIIPGSYMCDTSYLNTDSVVGNCRKLNPVHPPRPPYQPSDYTLTPFRWNIDGMDLLGTLVSGGSHTTPTSINKPGQVVGHGEYVQTSPSLDTPHHAIFWDVDENGAMQPPLDLGVFGGASNNFALSSEAYWINDQGKVVGYSSVDQQTEHAFVWDKASKNMVDLGSLSADYPNTRALKINNSDHPTIVGSAYAALGSPTVFIWDEIRGMRDLKQLSGGKIGTVTGLNDKGAVLGSQPGCNPCDTYLWNDGSTTKIDVPNATSVSGSGLNDLGEVVGEATINGVPTAIHWDAANGVIQLENTLDASGQGWGALSVNAINDKGWIIGSGFFDQTGHGFIMKPANIAQVYVGTGNFQTSGQSIWGPGTGSATKDLPLMLQVPQTPFSLGGYFNPLGLGDTGATFKGTLSAQAGLDFQASLSVGSVNVKYPVFVKLQFPDKDAIFAGDHIRVTSDWNIDNSATLSTVPFGANATLDAVARGELKALIHAKGLGNDIFDYDSGNNWGFDKQYRLFDAAALLGSGSNVDFDIGNLQILTGSLKLPRVDVVSAIPTTLTGLTGSGVDTFMSIRGNPTKLLTTVLHVPLDFGFQNSIAGGSVYANAAILQLVYGANFRLNEHLVFRSVPRIHLDFSDGRPPIEFDAGSSASIDMPTAPNDPILTITPTIILPNQLLHQLSLEVDRSGKFIPVELKAGGSFESYNLGSWDFHPWDIEFPQQQDRFDIVNNTFQLNGFTSQRMDKFTVAAKLHAAPSLISVEPSTSTLFIINDNESQTQNYDEFQKFALGRTKLIINGSNFLKTGTQTVLTYHGATTDLQTFYKNSGTLVAYVPNKFMLLPGVGRITVRTPNSVGESNSLDFTVEYPTPILTKVGPNLWAADPHLSDALLSVIGSNFIDRLDYFQPPDPARVGRLLQRYWNTLFPSENMQADFPDFDFGAAAPLPTVYWNDQPIGLYQEPIPSGFRPSLLPSSYFDRSQIAAVYVLNPGPGDALQSSTQTVFIGAPEPVLKGLEPSSAEPGSSGFRLAVKGSSQIPIDPHDLGKPAEGFEANSVVLWNGMKRSTMFISATELQADIPASDLLTGAINEISVGNPYVKTDGSTGTLSSNSIKFAVSNHSPSVVELLPPQALSASPNFQGTPKYNVSVRGTDFSPSSVLRWDGTARETKYLSSTQLEASLLASDVAVPGQHTVTVYSPPLGGGESNQMSFIISNAVPEVDKLVPATVKAGSAAFTLVLQGLGFYSGSAVTVNGANRTSHFRSPVEITVDLTLSDVAQPGSLKIGVVNPAPGGGTSHIVELQISP